MTARLIDGNVVAEAIRCDLREKVSKLASKGVRPGLAVIIVGEDPASQTYVRMKEKECSDLGILSRTIRLPTDTREEELLSIIDDLNIDDEVHAMLVQMPLPKQIDPQKVIMRIAPEKDADGFHPVNVGKMLIGDRSGFLPYLFW